MIESVIVGILAFLTCLFLSLYVGQIKKNKAILANTLQLLLMQQDINEESKTDKEQANEDFLKFISDSRDWAYTYIDEVQLGLIILLMILSQRLHILMSMELLDHPTHTTTL